MTKSVLIPLAEGFEELEAITLADLLARAGAQVTRAGLNAGPVTASRGTVVLPDCTLETVKEDQFDLIVLPGGLPGADHLMHSALLNTLLERHHSEQKPIGAICAAPKVLVNNGIASLHKITCYPGAVAMLDNKNIEVTTNAIEESGLIYTSRGPGTAMDFALFLIEKLFDAKTRYTVEESLVR